jgi:hypothetical protein
MLNKFSFCLCNTSRNFVGKLKSDDKGKVKCRKLKTYLCNNNNPGVFLLNFDQFLSYPATSITSFAQNFNSSSKNKKGIPVK